MLRFTFRILAALVTLASITSPARSDAVLLPQCAKVGTQVECDVRVGSQQQDLLPLPANPTSVTITWPNGIVDKADLERYSTEQKKTAWLLMIDNSKSMRKETFDRIVKDLSTVIGRTRGREQIAIATFGDKVEFVAPFSSASRNDLENTLKNIKPVSNKTHINASMLVGLDYLKGVTADRKALVVITDGREEDFNTSPRTVIDRAKTDHVAIYVFGYMQDKKDSRDLRELRELAEQTFGPYRFADLTNSREPVLPEPISTSFFSYMENGGTIKFPLRGNDFSLTAEIDRLQTPPRSVRLGTTTAASTFPGQAAWKRFEDAVGGPITAYVIAGLALVTVLGLIALALTLLLRSGPEESRRVSGAALIGQNVGGAVIGNQLPAAAAAPRPAPQQLSHNPPQPAVTRSTDATAGSNYNNAAATRIMGDDRAPVAVGETVAWLQRSDNNQRIAVRGRNIHIGRSDDNDIKFDVATVHRRHANLHMTAKRDFVITDLSGEAGNGVKVNAARINKQATLSDGDTLEIGEMKLRFYRASA